MIKDIKKLGYSEVVLKCDGEPALKSVQEEVKRRRTESTILELLYSFPGEETAKFQAYSSIDQSYWNQKIAATEKLTIFDDGDDEELEHDVYSFEDKTTHLTSAVLRRGVEVSML